MTIRLRSISPIQVFFQEKQHDYREQHRNTKCVRRLEFNQKILRRMKKKILLSLVHGLVPNTYMKLLSRDKHQVGMSNMKKISRKVRYNKIENRRLGGHVFQKYLNTHSSHTNVH